MQIEFKRTGGFAGMRLSASVDTQQLRQDQGARLEKMVADVGFFGLPENIKPASPTPDRFEYSISVSSAGQAHTVVVSEASVSEELRPLLDYLTTLAMIKKDR